VTWNYTYDAFKRLKRGYRSVAGGVTTTYKYGYDAASNRVWKFDGAESHAYAYNSLDQLIQETVGAGEGAVVKAFRYDVFGNLEKEYEDGALRRQYTWDGSNRLVKAELRDANGDLLQTLSYGYDDRGTRIRKQVDAAGGPVGDPDSKFGDYLENSGTVGAITSVIPTPKAFFIGFRASRVA
jgi:hypothetical protein